MQRGIVLLVLGVDVGASVEQQPHDPNIASTGSGQEQALLISIVCSRVDVGAVMQ